MARPSKRIVFTVSDELYAALVKAAEREQNGTATLPVLAPDAPDKGVEALAHAIIRYVLLSDSKS